MVFSSVPLYPDPPHWNQQQASTNKLLINEPTQASSSPSQTNTCNRPVTMAERAKMAKIPQAEAALKCPRCDSTNTKFCYFNNYSLTQPRHFCKTCRRYWTRGGALRSVPVGGGCRRNKRGNKPSSSSKSSTPVSVPTNPLPAPPPPTFLAPWHHMQDYGFGGIQEGAGAPAESMGLEQWRIQQIQQFPFLGGGVVEQTAMMVPGLYPFEEHGKINNMPIVKMEESNSSQVVVRAEAGSSSAVNFPRQFFNMGEQHLSGFNSSSNGNFL